MHKKSEKNTKGKKLKVIDFFCGAGGFSEGFRQQDFEIVLGVDNWKPAVETHNINHGLEDSVMNVLDFENSIESIENLPDTDIIIGSPPCVSFSMSNRAGKADKSLGIRLIESYLRFVAVKKHKPNSGLRAWLMENVPNSRNYVNEKYTFKDLRLSEWSKSIGKKPNDVALLVKNNGDILTASDYGSPQKRSRFVCGEIVNGGKFPRPKKSHTGNRIPLSNILNKMPKPNETMQVVPITDPNYSKLNIYKELLTDHFYDTGVYEVEWRESKFGKVNHPFMGKMSFPENTNNPSRTIMATKSASTREAILYPSELDRKGDGEFRTPTIREAATLMGFPYTYQFKGSEGTKWRLIGNAVCPHMSSALAAEIRNQLGLRQVKTKILSTKSLQNNISMINNLNNWFKPKVFNNPPSKKAGSKFRRHTVKGGNITVNLINHNPLDENTFKYYGRKWFACVFIGSGKNYKVELIDRNSIEKSLELLKKNGYGSFIKTFLGEFLPRIKSPSHMQQSYEKSSLSDEYNPIVIIDDLADLISNQEFSAKLLEATGIISKSKIPASQMMSIYGVGHLSGISLG